MTRLSIQNQSVLDGALGVRKLPKEVPAPKSWHLKNKSRFAYWQGLIGNKAAKGVSKLFGIPTLTSELSIRVLRLTESQRITYNKIVKDDGLIGGRKWAKKYGTWENYGVVERRVITTAFVNFMVDQLQAETSVWGDFKFHDSGVGTTAAAIGDTDIETTDGESRATGTQTEGASANIYRSVGTISYTTTKAITEHGLFSIATGGTLMDRHVFSAINVVNGDSIEYTYELTVSSGG
jgi:hypothetical protein